MKLNLKGAFRVLFGVDDDVSQTSTTPPRVSKISDLIDEIEPFSADAVSSILHNAAGGEIGDLWRFYLRMGTVDPFLGGLVLHLRSAISQQPVRVQFRQTAPTYIEDLYRPIIDGFFDFLDVRRAVHLMVDAHLFGASLFTIEWAKDESFGTVRLFPKAIDRVPFRGVKMITDISSADYGWLAVVEKELSQPTPITKLAPESYLYVEAEPARYRYHMVGAMRRVVGWFAIKQIVQRLWVDFAQTYGPPIRIGYYEPLSSDKQREILRRALSVLGENSWAMLPSDISIELKEPNRTGTVTVYSDLIDYCHQQYAVALIGTADIVGNNREGSYARLRVSNSIRYEFIRNVAAIIEEGLTKLLRKTLQINLGDKYNHRYAPKVVLRVVPPDDQLSIARTIETLVRAGFTVPRSFVEEVFNIPSETETEPNETE
jgi:hypothetical protein